MEETHISTNTEAPESDDRAPLWKQLMGAVVGGGLALTLYYGYDAAKPQLAAYLTLPAAEGGRLFDIGAASIADKSLEDNERKRVVSRNMRAAQQLENSELGYNELAAADDHSLDIDWPGHEAEELPEEVMMDGFDSDMTDDDMDGSFEMQMATKNMEMEDDWDSLWGDIRDRENTSEIGESSNAPTLPDSGAGIGFLVAGAAGGAASSRFRKKKA
ncbi:hypothetical protein COU75_01080 [Candidatus Peregrinibacteria bacterium CG10_big_fil_rev_8_21_14_0_10_42_8]|nr:MAG: hypothetical protein COU75_01080 [Candidatus Peregrinibacteria bacterium CG10_big_fil_rev_8_21_14_0_10_42_8]